MRACEALGSAAELGRWAALMFKTYLRVLIVICWAINR